jgi:hypothetical protein
MAKADDYCGAKSCGCRADDYDPAYWDNVRKENKCEIGKIIKMINMCKECIKYEVTCVGSDEQQEKCLAEKNNKWR